MNNLTKTIILLISTFITQTVSGQNSQSQSDTTLQVPAASLTHPSLEQMHQAILSKEYPNVHSVLVMHRNKLIFEKYYTAKDEALGEDLGIVKHSTTTLHDLRSVTKSIVSICVGLAIQQGKIHDEKEPVMKYFPAYKTLDTGLRSQLTIKHLLTMSSGMVWNENLPYTDTMNSELAMSASADPIRYILSRPVVVQPGTEFNYNGGNTQLLGAIIEKTSGMSLDKFVDRYLFKPLGIKKFYWYTVSERTKAPAAASGLRLSSGDMMKIGLLLLNNGVVNGRQLLSKEWIDRSFTSEIPRDKEGGGYGYQFWIFKTPEVKGQHASAVSKNDREKTGTTVVNDHELVSPGAASVSSQRPLPAAVGNGDQRIFIDRDAQLVVVITSGNYNKWDLKKASYELLADFIYPSISN